MHAALDADKTCLLKCTASMLISTLVVQHMDPTWFEQALPSLAQLMQNHKVCGSPKHKQKKNWSSVFNLLPFFLKLGQSLNSFFKDRWSLSAYNGKTSNTWTSRNILWCVMEDVTHLLWFLYELGFCIHMSESRSWQRGLIQSLLCVCLYKCCSIVGWQNDTVFWTTHTIQDVPNVAIPFGVSRGNGTGDFSKVKLSGGLTTYAVP